MVVPLFTRKKQTMPICSRMRAASGYLTMKSFLSMMARSGPDGRATQTCGETVLRFAKKCRPKRRHLCREQAARGATAVLIDGDLQNDPADIPRLLAEIHAARSGLRLSRPSQGHTC